MVPSPVRISASPSPAKAISQSSQVRQPFNNELKYIFLWHTWYLTIAHIFFFFSFFQFLGFKRSGKVFFEVKKVLHFLFITLLYSISYREFVKRFLGLIFFVMIWTHLFTWKIGKNIFEFDFDFADNVWIFKKLRGVIHTAVSEKKTSLFSGCS